LIFLLITYTKSLRDCADENTKLLNTHVKRQNSYKNWLLIAYMDNKETTCLFQFQECALY